FVVRVAVRFAVVAVEVRHCAIGNGDLVGGREAVVVIGVAAGGVLVLDVLLVDVVLHAVGVCDARVDRAVAVLGAAPRTVVTVEVRHASAGDQELIAGRKPEVSGGSVLGVHVVGIDAALDGVGAQPG